MIYRLAHTKVVNALLNEFPVVAVLGTRQVGKTTLAGMIADQWQAEITRFDIEDPRDMARLAEPMMALSPLRGLVVLDEIQRAPELFPVLRVLADKRVCRFLILGSASPELVQRGAESLAGRIAFYELPGLTLPEVGASNMQRLWFRGGFPRAYLGKSDMICGQWLASFIKTYLERDLPQLGINLPARTLQRFWNMLAHYHGQTWNGCELARALGVSDKTVRRYLDVLAATFMVRVLPPWHANLKKRQVKAPKVYLSDSGILHRLLGIPELAQLSGHPKVGASWEGFAMNEVIAAFGAKPEECFYWALHTGAELDLMIVRGTERLGFEFKLTDSPKPTRSMHAAQEMLDLSHLYIVHAGQHAFPMGHAMDAVPLSQIISRAD